MSSKSKSSLQNFANLSLDKPQIKDSDTLLKLFCCLTIAILLCIALGHYAFKNGHLTCDHYVFNTYLYIILAIMLMFIIVLLNDQTGIFNGILSLFLSPNIAILIITLIVFAVAMIVLYYALANINPENLLVSNAIWLALVFLLGITLIPIVFIGRLFGVVGLAAILTVVLVISVGLIGYYFGYKIVTFDWEYYLKIAIIILVVVAVIGIFVIRDPQKKLQFSYVISIISLIIFVLLLLVNHKKIKENADKCIDGSVVPNYPLESWNIVLEIVIIFRNLINILLVRKLRRY
jgi:FtsH-binding integral membrane protein